MSTIDDIPLRALRVLEAVAAQGGFAAAGRQLGLSRAAVSRIAVQLEAQLRVRLFRRTTRRVVLTDAAAQLAAQVSRSLPALRDALESAAADEDRLSGTVRISVSHGFGRRYVLPSVTRFVALQPAVLIDVHLHDRLDDLVATPIDIAVRMGPLPSSSMIARRVGRLDTVLVAAPAISGRRRSRAWTLRDLSDLPGVQFRIPGTGEPVPWSITHEGRLHTIYPSRVVVRSDSIEGIADLARLGVGAAFVPRYLVEDDIARKRLVVIAEGGAGTGPEVHLCFLDRRLLPPRVRALIAHLMDDLRGAIGSRQHAG